MAMEYLSKAKEIVEKLTNVIKCENELTEIKNQQSLYCSEIFTDMCSYLAELPEKYAKKFEELKKIAGARKIEAGETYRLAYLTIAQNPANKPEAQSLASEGEILYKSAENIEFLIKKE